MRDYSYLWRVERNRLIISGIEFHDFKQILGNKQVLLIKAQCNEVVYDAKTRFNFIIANDIVEDDTEIYSWGDFVFLVARDERMMDISPSQIKDILYFGHTGQYEDSLNDAFMAGVYIHDNGWYLSLSGSIEMIDVFLMLFKKYQNQIDLKIGEAQLSYMDSTIMVPGSFDIDMILNKYLMKIGPTR